MIMAKEELGKLKKKVNELKKDLTRLDKEYEAAFKEARMNGARRPEIPLPGEVAVTPNRTFFSGWVYERGPILLREHLSLLFIASFSAATIPFALVSLGWTVPFAPEDLWTAIVIGTVIPFLVGFGSWVLKLRFCRLCGSDFFSVNPTTMVCSNCMKAYAPLFDTQEICEELDAMYRKAIEREDEEHRLFESVKTCHACDGPVKWSRELADYQCPRHGNGKMQDISRAKADLIQTLGFYQNLVGRQKEPQ